MTQPARQGQVKRCSLMQFIECECENEALVTSIILLMMESLILAQDERWRRGLGMQVER